jgi:peptidoglycan/LPS O-acetylase OafA/YrhL
MYYLRERLQLLVPKGFSSSTFDLLRWIAAAYVVIFHLRPVLFQGISNLHNPGALVKVLYAATSLGYQFVMLFFVLSGYLIASSVLRSMSEGTWSWKVYLVNRLVRLWIVLLPALILSVFLARVEIARFHNPGVFQVDMTWRAFIGNLFFLQGILVPDFAQNLPLWSLAYEFWYYILFPCMILMVLSKRWVSRIIYGLLFFSIAVFLGKNIMLYFVIWLLGAALAVLPHRQLSRRATKLFWIPLTLGVLVIALVIGKVYNSTLHVPNFDMVEGFPPNVLVSMVFLGLLYIVLHNFNHPSKNSRFIKVSSGLANISYTLYLTHYPIVNLIRVWLGNGEWGTWTPNTLHLFWGIGIFSVILLYAYGVAGLTEAHTSAVRKVVLRVLNFKRRQTPTLSDSSPYVEET